MVQISAFYDFWVHRLIATSAIVEVSIIIYIAYKKRLLGEMRSMTDRLRTNKKGNGIPDILWFTCRSRASITGQDGEE